MENIDIAAYITDPFGDVNLVTSFNDISFGDRKHQTKNTSLQDKYSYLPMILVHDLMNTIDPPFIESQSSPSRTY